MAFKELGNSLFTDVLKKVKRTKLPYFIHDETLQKGKSFGEKIVHAIDTTIKKGFDNIIIIGNDTPELSFSILDKAVTALNQGKLVYGRSTDNGIYLLAVNTKTFDRYAIKHLPWQTKSLSQALEGYLNGCELPFLRLRTLRDIDKIQDVHVILDNALNSLSTEIRHILITFLFSFKHVYYFIKSTKNFILNLPSGTRGSPMLQI